MFAYMHAFVCTYICAFAHTVNPEKFVAENIRVKKFRVKNFRHNEL